LVSSREFSGEPSGVHLPRNSLRNDVGSGMEFRGRCHEILGPATDIPGISPSVFAPVFVGRSLYFPLSCDKSPNTDDRFGRLRATGTRDIFTASEKVKGGSLSLRSRRRLSVRPIEVPFPTSTRTSLSAISLWREDDGIPPSPLPRIPGSTSRGDLGQLTAARRQGDRTGRPGGDRSPSSPAARNGGRVSNSAKRRPRRGRTLK
jgi:hypothetical protein